MFKSQGGRSQRSALNTFIVFTSLGGGLFFTFLLAPLIYGATAGWITDFAVEHYGSAMGGFTGFMWGLLISVTLFGSASAAFVTLFKSAALAVGSRLTL